MGTCGIWEITGCPPFVLSGRLYDWQRSDSRPAALIAVVLEHWGCIKCPWGRIASFRSIVATNVEKTTTSNFINDDGLVIAHIELFTKISATACGRSSYPNLAKS